MYRIENTTSEHASVLKYTVATWGERQPDVYLVSKEGVKVYTQRILLGFYSKIIGEMLESNKDDLVGISVPASSSSLTMMLKVLVSGSVIGNNKENLLEVGQAAESLGIVLNDRQIGYRRKKSSQVDAVKETVEINGRKVSYRKSAEVGVAPEIKSEPAEESIENMDASEDASAENIQSKKNKNLSSANVSGVDKTCNQCGKSFPSTGRLKIHMNVHKDDKAKPFKCDVCEKGFSSAASLKNHKLLHTGEVHKCEYCEYTAVQKGNLKTHRLKIHKDLLEVNESNNVSIGQDDENVVQENVTMMKEELQDRAESMEESERIDKVDETEGAEEAKVTEQAEEV